MPAARSRTRRSYRRRQPYRRRRSYGRYTRSYGRRNAPRRQNAKRQRKGVVLTKFTLAQIDPFNEKVYGAKIPDANTIPSSTCVIQDDYNLSADAVYGTAAQAFMPYLGRSRTVGTAGSSTSWTWPASFNGDASSKLSSVSGNFNVVRPVAHGIRISCALAPTAVTGLVHVGIYTNGMLGASTWDLPINIGQLGNAVWYKKFPLSMLTAKPLTIINKIGDVSSQLYREPSSVVSGNAGDLVFQTNGWGTIVIAVTGAPLSSIPVAVEAIIHIEGQPSSTGVLTSSPAADFNPAELAATSRVASVTDATMWEGSEPNHLQEAVNAIQSGAQNAFEAVDTNIRSGIRYAGERAGEYVVSSAFDWIGNQIRGNLPGVNTARLMQ